MEVTLKVHPEEKGFHLDCTALSVRLPPLWAPSALTYLWRGMQRDTLWKWMKHSFKTEQKKEQLAEKDGISMEKQLLLFPLMAV